ncbi:hypothetical protein QYF36_020328 [Acer negundo]|nr:hypothetical protein QYF36_020328 [Acer negundo]
MLEVDNLFITGFILPLEASSEKGFRCEGFGRIESWTISGYDEGSPVIWVSTDVADYDCVRPASNYKMLYNLFFENARACMEVYKILSKTCGGSPDLTLDELLGKVVFEDLPVLAALRKENKKHVIAEATASGSLMNTGLRIGEGEQISQSSSSACGSTEEGDMKLARYRLGKPSNQYAPWYEPVLKTVRLAVAKITLLKDQSFTDVIKRVSELSRNDPAYISSNPPTLERHVVVHGQIILQQFSEFPDETFRKCAFVTGDSVLVGTADSDQLPPIYHIEYMFEKSDAIKMVHGRLMQRGSQTVLANTADEREVFLTNICLEFELEDIKEIVVVEIRSIPWGHQHWKANAYKDKADRERARDRKVEGLSIEYYCKSLYWPERGAFFRLPTETMGLGSGVCHSCQIKETEREKEALKLDLCGKGFTFKGIEYRLHDFVYLSPDQFAAEDKEQETFNSGRNVGLKAYAICQLLEIEVTKEQVSAKSTKVKVQRFFRPEDISTEKAYCSDIREVYYSEQVLTVPIIGIEGKCDIRKKHDLPSMDSPVTFEHIFFCEHLYNPHKELSSRKKKDKGKERVLDDEIAKETDALHKKCLATLDIFAGVSQTKWAIEYEEPAGEIKAFGVKFNLEPMVFLNHVNEHSYPEEQLPEWPEPMHVFASPELKIKLSEDTHYAAVRSTANGAPFRSITVRDTIGDLPAVGNAGTGKETFPPPLLTLNQWVRWECVSTLIRIG